MVGTRHIGDSIFNEKKSLEQREPDFSGTHLSPVLFFRGPVADDNSVKWP